MNPRLAAIDPYVGIRLVPTRHRKTSYFDTPLTADRDGKLSGGGMSSYKSTIHELQIELTNRENVARSYSVSLVQYDSPNSRRFVGRKTLYFSGIRPGDTATQKFTTNASPDNGCFFIEEIQIDGSKFELMMAATRMDSSLTGSDQTIEKVFGSHDNPTPLAMGCGCLTMAALGAGLFWIINFVSSWF